MTEKPFTEIKIFLASPSDTKPERETVGIVIDEVNEEICKDNGYDMKLIRWETDTYPQIDGRDGQEIINEQLALVDFKDYALFIGLMWLRFGEKTPRAGSGTEEEFNLALKAQEEGSELDIMFLFNSKPPSVFPNQDDIDQLIKVIMFKKRMEGIGLYREYNGSDCFKDKIRRYLILWLRTNIFNKWRI